MKHALIGTGILAAIAVACPQLVGLGYLLILPGLVLTIAPTVFVYLAVAAGIRCCLPIKSRLASTTAACCLSLLLGWAVMQPFRARALADYQAGLKQDIASARPLVLGGEVRLERAKLRPSAACDYLATALVDLPGVRSVTVEADPIGSSSQEKATKAYAIVSAEDHPEPGNFPEAPGQILREHPERPRTGDSRLAQKAIAADWALRLAGDVRLIETEPVASERADWVIRLREAKRRGAAEVYVEVIDAEGQVAFRRSHVARLVPASLFYLGFDLSRALTPAGNPRFSVGRQRMAAGDRTLKPEAVLLGAIACPLPPADVAAIDRLRSEVNRTLSEPDPTDAALQLPRWFLSLFTFDVKQQDHDLIARVVGDDRVTGISEALRNAFSQKRVPVEMQSAFARRLLMDHTDAELRHWLAECLAAMPPGTFAEPDASHLKIWSDPTVYREAGPFLACLADLDAEFANVGLRNALRTAVQITDRRQRRSIVNAIREACLRMGPAAAPLEPTIRDLFLQRPSPIVSSSKDADLWRLALAHMGVAIEDLPFFPNQSPATIEKIQRRVVQRLAKHRIDNAERARVGQEG